ncbi:transposase [Streptomyces sp. ATCC 21386]|uniref:transposase n=1 Tax=Streptomyces sp. ATCC 21386 TaxID=2699428 RepID=UPI002044E555|nr:transposase [Streptomyces sp. ATCC 21386]
MESMGKKKPHPRRSFTPEFKAEIVELCQRGDRSVGQVAKDFDLTGTAVTWMRAYRGAVSGAQAGTGR